MLGPQAFLPQGLIRAHAGTPVRTRQITEEITEVRSSPVLDLRIAWVQARSSTGLKPFVSSTDAADEHPLQDAIPEPHSSSTREMVGHRMSPPAARPAARHGMSLRQDAYHSSGSRPTNFETGCKAPAARDFETGCKSRSPAAGTNFETGCTRPVRQRSYSVRLSFRMNFRMPTSRPMRFPFEVVLQPVSNGRSVVGHRSTPENPYKGSLSG